MALGCKVSLAQAPPGEDPWIFGNHAALAAVVTGNTCVNGRARDALFSGDAGYRLGSQKFAPRLALYRGQVDEVLFLQFGIARGGISSGCSASAGEKKAAGRPLRLPRLTG